MEAGCSGQGNAPESKRLGSCLPRMLGSSGHTRKHEAAKRVLDIGSWDEVLSLLPAPNPRLSGARAAARFLMSCQERHAGEGLGAALALVFLGVRVCLQVGSEIGAVCEGPAAMRAGIGLLPWGRKRGGPGE